MRVYRVSMLRPELDGTIHTWTDHGESVVVGGVSYVSIAQGQMLMHDPGTWRADIQQARDDAADKIVGIANKLLEEAERVRQGVHRA